MSRELFAEAQSIIFEKINKKSNQLSDEKDILNAEIDKIEPMLGNGNDVVESELYGFNMPAINKELVLKKQNLESDLKKVKDNLSQYSSLNEAASLLKVELARKGIKNFIAIVPTKYLADLFAKVSIYWFHFIDVHGMVPIVRPEIYRYPISKMSRVFLRILLMALFFVPVTVLHLVLSYYGFSMPEFIVQTTANWEEGMGFIVFIILAAIYSWFYYDGLVRPVKHFILNEILKRAGHDDILKTLFPGYGDSYNLSDSLDRDYWKRHGKLSVDNKIPLKFKGMSSKDDSEFAKTLRQCKSNDLHITIAAAPEAIIFDRHSFGPALRAKKKSQKQFFKWLKENDYEAWLQMEPLILYGNDKVTVILDQTGKFPEEKAIIDLAKEYKL